MSFSTTYRFPAASAVMPYGARNSPPPTSPIVWTSVHGHESAPAQELASARAAHASTTTSVATIASRRDMGWYRLMASMPSRFAGHRWRITARRLSSANDLQEERPRRRCEREPRLDAGLSSFHPVLSVSD